MRTSPGRSGPLTATAFAVCLAALALPSHAAFLRGVGAVGIGSDADAQYIIDQLGSRGFNHVQAWMDAKDPKLPARIERLHDAGFTVFDYTSAFLDIPGPRDDFQIRADGSVKTGTVCPRSRARLDEMVQRCLTAASVGADGLCWDFITVESTELEACFCPDCLAALNVARGQSLSRDDAVALLQRDPAALLTWRTVREQSTTEAIRYVCQQVHQNLGDKPFQVGGYVLGSHSNLGMDTAEMYKYLDVGAPMIYQATGPAPLGWMLGSLRGFQAYGGRAQNVVCVDTGFFVKQPWQELLTTSFDCIRGKADGYCLWPFATVSQDDLEAVSVLNELDKLVYEPLRVAGVRASQRTGPATPATAGTEVPGPPADSPAVAVPHLPPGEGRGEGAVPPSSRAALSRGRGGQGGEAAVASGLRNFATLHAASLSPDQQAALATLADNLAAYPDFAYTDDFANALWPSMIAAAQGRIRASHATDRIVEVAPYRVQIAADGSSLAISTEDWALTQGNMAENIDEVVFRGLYGNAATGNANLGLLRLRIIDWFDGWGGRNETRIVEQDADLVAIRTTVRSDTCEIARQITLRRGAAWMDIKVTVTNLDTKPRKGKLWLWNGFGIPGYLEPDPGAPWADDHSTLVDNTLTISDEGCHLSLAADSADLKLGAFGGDGTSHAYKDLALNPGEVFETAMQMRLWRD